MDNPEKPATQSIQGEEKQSKNTTQYMLYTTISTNNVNKTRALLQTIGSKDEPNVNKTRALLQTIGRKDEPNVNKTRALLQTIGSKDKPNNANKT